MRKFCFKIHIITFFVKYNGGNWDMNIKRFHTMNLCGNLMSVFKFALEIGCISSTQS